MKTIEIITNFDIEQTDLLEKTFDLKSKTIVVNSSKLYRHFQNSNNRVVLLDERYYSGYDNPHMNRLYDYCIVRTETFADSFSEIKTLVPFGNLLRFETIRELRFLQWAHLTLRREKNPIFIFENSSFLYNSILILAKDMGFFYKFGLSSLTNSEIKSKLTFNYKSKFLDFIDNLNGIDDEIIDKEISLFFQNHDFDIDYSTVVSFIQTDPLEMSSRSLSLVIEKLRSKRISNLIFTYNKNVLNSFNKKDLDIINLGQYISQIEKIDITSSELKIITNFYKILSELKFKDGILNAYLDSFFNRKKLTRLKLLLRNIEILKIIFNDSKFTKLLLSSDGQLVTDVVCQIAKKYNTKTIQIASSLHRWNSFRSYFYPASLICLNGKIPYQQMLASGVNEKRLCITGNPYFEHLSQISSITIKTKNDSKSKTILLALSRWKENDEIWISEFIHYCNQHNHNLVIRPHPSYYLLSNPKDSSLWRLDLVERNCDGLKYEISNEKYITNYLKYDMVITDYSTFGIDFALRGIPLILIAFESRRKELSGTLYLKTKTALAAHHMDDLYAIIDLISNDLKTQEMYEEATILFRDEFECFDGTGATQNIINKLSEFSKPIFL